ncbi:MAG: hypothetical protein JW786_03250 [Desulfobacterales bacterium]|nr:hypothetical protein [Desulfobacterales bacterium]
MLKKSCIPVTLSMHRKRLSISMALYAVIMLTLLFAPSLPVSVFASVSGPCSECHTMHYSQNGSPLTGEDVGADGPYKTLLKNDCLGCHTGTNDGTNIVPYVNSGTEPTFGTNTLAGGNFYWVQTEDTKGHNVFFDNPDDNLVEAPGDVGFDSCGTNACHANLHAVSSGVAGLENRQGCEKCHLNVKHHAGDGTGTKYVNSAEQGWYRFLSGHLTGAGKGVEGIEHEKWNYDADASSHNEYLGAIYSGDYGFDLGNTTTAYCTGCHGKYHEDQVFGEEDSGNPWVRHPSDAIIPNEGEYADAFGAAGTGTGTYDPGVPVARPAGFAWAAATPSSAVTIGTDLVMCLSCHVAHGSPYDDLLRWDYSEMIASSGNTGGCFQCHTLKD